MQWSDAELAELADLLQPHLQQRIADGLEPVLRDVLGLAVPGGRGGNVLEPGTVQDTALDSGEVLVLLDSGTTMTVPCGTVLPAVGERVYVEFYPPHGPLIVGRVRGVPMLLGRPGMMTASPGPAGTGGLNLGANTRAVVQGTRLVLVTGHCLVDTPSGALTARLLVYDGAVLVGTAAAGPVSAGGLAVLHGAVLLAAPATGVHDYRLVVATDTGTVVPQPTGWVLAQDVGSAGLV